MTDMTRFNLPELTRAGELARAALSAAKAEVAAVDAEVGRRFTDSTWVAFGQAGKSHGTMTLPLQDGLALKCDVKKTVTWDSDKLMALAKTLPWDRVCQLFNIKFSMSETVYKGVAIAAPDLAKQVDEARTVKFGEPAITLTQEA